MSTVYKCPSIPPGKGNNHQGNLWESPGLALNTADPVVCSIETWVLK